MQILTLFLLLTLLVCTCSYVLVLTLLLLRSCWAGAHERTTVLLRVVHNVYGYYAQFAGHVVAKLGSLRDPIAAELKDQVKLAKWEDQSYFALKVSSERNTRTLQKFCTRFAQVRI